MMFWGKFFIYALVYEDNLYDNTKLKEFVGLFFYLYEWVEIFGIIIESSF